MVRSPEIFEPVTLFGGRMAEPLQKILHLEIFWGFRTRTAAAGGGQYLSGRGGRTGQQQGGGRPGRRCRAGAGGAQGGPRATAGRRSGEERG